jgi:hypothetical protein
VAAAERVFGYAQAAGHWQRAIELWPVVPGAAGLAGVGLPQPYLHAISAAELSGDTGHASVIAKEAYSRFAGHPDPAICIILSAYGDAFYRAPIAAGLDRACARFRVPSHCMRLAYCRDY